MMETFQNCISPCLLLAAYFSSLGSGDDDDSTVFSRVLVVIGLAGARLAYSSFHWRIEFSKTLTEWLHLICTVLQFLCSCILFFLSLQFNDKERPAERIFQMENAFAIIFIIFVRVASPHFKDSKDCFWQVFCIDLLLGTTSLALVLFLPPTMANCSASLQQDSAAAWGIFATMAVAHIFCPCSAAQQDSWKVANSLGKALLLALSLAVRCRGVVPCSGQRKVQDYQFFYNITSNYPFIVRAILVAWTALSSARWFSKMIKTIIPPVQQPQNSKATAAAGAAECEEADREDLEFGLALAGLMMALYSCMSSSHKGSSHGLKILDAVCCIGVTFGIIFVVEQTAVFVRSISVMTTKRKAS
jgi:hypothetical protein